MTSRPPLPEGPFLLVGLARSGAAAATLLAGIGERVVGVDAGSPAEAERLAQAGVEVHLDEDGTALLDGIATLVKSPGVPKEAPVIAEARRRGIPVLGELELAWRALPNRFVAVTGTNGKTTTVELIGHLFREAGEPVAVAGNVGTPLASLVGELDEKATVVCEASSFQLEDSEAFAPECAVFLNLAPDHLDRHGTPEDYMAAKLRAFANQGPGDVAILNGDDPALAEIELGGDAELVRFCPGGGDCEMSLDAGEIRWRGQSVVRADELHLLGRHNIGNAMAAAAAALSLGLAVDAVARGLRSFEGVPHRLEPVAAIDGVLFVNDSKATNVTAARAAVSAFEGGVHLILGGSLKGESFERLAEPVAERAAAVYLIGEAAERIEADLAAAAGAVPIEHAAGLEDAVSRAAAAATAGQVVLLAPACASFDAYGDYEQRGEHFRELVGGLE